uniref:Protein-L-isoaspartate O-methyltransferase n=1 Tax=Globisporangium ultimum (strain ATCC 200006 / CBS 805.95 / DAOM BR144) TaxID=431595 RepID=K3WFY6_GLOUD
MAWRCSARSNDGLVDNLARAGIVQSQRVIAAMKAVDRGQYMTTTDPDVAYQDAPQVIGHQQTISAPHMHAFALELADVAISNVEQPRILDVGAGSGYLTACLGRMVEDRGGRVFGIERIPELVAFAKKNIERADRDLIDKHVVSVQGADGWEGLPNEAPFHFIHVGAAAVEPPQSLMDQLADGGRLVVPVGEQGASQVLLEIQRTDQTFTQRQLMGVSYVPLVRERTEL